MNQIDPDIKTIYKLILKKGYVIHEQTSGDYLFTNPENAVSMYVSVSNKVEVSLYFGDDDKYYKNYYK